MEVKVNINISIPEELSIKIDKLLLAYREQGVRKLKRDFIVELIYMGYNLNKIEK